MTRPASDHIRRPPFGLSFAAGRGLVTLRQHAVAGLVRVESLEMEIPDLRFPFDVSGGARHFRHRRCRLRRCELSVSEQQLERWLAERLERAAYGYGELRLRLRHDHFELSGRATVGGDSADFIARGVVLPGAAGVLGVALGELRLFETFPVPAPLLAAGLLRAVGGVPAHERAGADIKLVGCCDIELDPLALALLHVLPPAGWRLPSMNVRLASVALNPGELRLTYDVAGASDKGTAAGADGVGLATPARYIATQEAKRLFAQAERLIESGEIARAIDVYRRELTAHPQHPFIYERLLQLLVANADQDSETLKLARTARATFGVFTAADLVEAVALARSQSPAAAAETLRGVAERAAREQSATEELLATMAAGRAELAGGEQAAARADFERVLELSRDHAGAQAQLARLYSQANEWQRLIAIRKRQIARATSDEQRLAGHLALGEIYRVHLGEPELAREQFERALQIDDACEPALHGLAEACIEAEETLRAVRALDRLAEIAAARADHPATIAIHLRIASLWEHLGDREGALARLRRARALGPTEAQTLRRIARLLLSMGRQREAIDALRELLDVTREPDHKVALHRQIAEAQRDLGDRDSADREIARALAIDPANADVLQLAVESAEVRGEPGELADVLARAAKAEGDTQRRAALLLRRGRLLARTGRNTDALAALEAAADDADDAGWAARREVARVAARAERWEDARDAWLAALDTPRGANDAEGWYALARVQRQLGDLAATRAALQTAVDAADPPDARAVEELAEVTAELGDHEGRRDALERLLPLLARQQLDDDQHRAAAATRLAELAELRADAGETAGALDLYERARALTPDNDTLLWRLADLHEESDETLAAAQPLLEALVERGELASRARAAARLGAVLRALGQAERALGAFERAIEMGLPPDQSERAWREVSRLRLAQGDASEAARALERSSTLLDNSSARAQRLYEAAQIWHKRASHRKQATRCYEAALEQRPDHRGALDALEAIYAGAESLQQLARVLAVKVESAGSHPAEQTALLARLAATLSRLGDDAGARETHGRALEVDPYHLPSLLVLAREAQQSGADDEARRLYERALEALARHRAAGRALDPDGGGSAEREAALEAHLALAELCHGDDGEAEEQHLVQARRVAPADERVLAKLEALYAKQGRASERAELLAGRVARTRDPAQKLEVGKRHAELLLELGAHDDAVSAYEQLVGDSRDDRELLEGLARALRRAKRWPRLLEVLEQLVPALDAAGESDHDGDATSDAAVSALTEAGQIALRLEQPSRARQHLEAALARRPDKLAALDGYSALLRADGSEEALARLEPILGRRAAREHHQARRIALTIEQAELCQRRGDAERAAAVLDAAIDADDHDGELLLLAARVNEQLGRLSRAARAYDLLRETAIRPAEERHAVRQLLRLIAGPLDAPERLLPLCQRLLELTPDDREALDLLAQSHEERGEHDAAANALARLLDLLQRHYGRAVEQLDVALRLADVLARASRRGEIGAVLSAALRRAGDDAKQLARVAGAAQMHLEASVELAKRSTIDVNATYTGPAAGLGADVDALGEIELAARRRLAKIDPSSAPQQLLRVAELERAAGRPGEAAEALHAALDGLPPGPARADVARDLLRAIDTEDDADAALVALGVLEQEDSTDAERWRLAELLTNRGQPAQALALLERIAPENVDAEALAELRWTLLERMGNQVELARELERRAREEAEGAQARAKALSEAARRWLRKARSSHDAARCIAAATRADPHSLAALHRGVHELIASGAGDVALEMLEDLSADADTFAPARLAALCCLDAVARRELGEPWSNVRAAYERALTFDASCAEALDGLVALSRDLADREALVEALTRRAQAGADSETRHAALLEAAGIAARDLNRPEQARPLVEQARALRPGDADTLQLVAEITLALGDNPATEEALVALAELGRDPERNLARACGLARLRGDRAAETDYLARLGALRPASSQIKRRLANVYREAGNLDGLRRQLEQLAPEDNQAQFELAQLLAGSLDDALAAHDAYAQLLAVDPGHRAAREEMVALCRQLGFHRDVAEHLRALIDREPAQATARRGELLSELADVYRDQLGDDTRAADALREAMKTFGAGERWSAAARQLIPLAPPDETRDLLFELMRINAATREELARLARDAERADEPQRAELALRRLLAIDDTPDTAMRLGALLRARGDFTELAELLERSAARQGPRDAARSLVEAAEHFERSGQPERAEAALRRAIERVPEQDEAATALLDLLRRLGARDRLADALEAFARAVDETDVAGTDAERGDDSEHDDDARTRRVARLEELAELADALGQRQRAALAREALFAADPQRAELLPPLLERALDRRDRQRAANLIEAARARLDDSSLLADGLRRLAQLELDADDPRGAAKLVEQSLELEGGSVETLELKLAIAERVGDGRGIADAQLALAALREGQEAVAALRGAAAALRLLPDEHDRCVAVHRELVERCPDDPALAETLERLLREAADPRELVAFLWRALADKSGAERVAQLLEIARIEQSLDRMTWAERAFREALDCAPGDARALGGLVDNLAARGEYAQIAELLEPALADDEASRALGSGDGLEHDVLVDLATRLGQICLDRLGEHERGVRWLTHACELSPDADQALRRLLAHHRDRSDYAAAAGVLELSLTRRDARAEGVAELWEELGRLREARLDDLVGAARAYQAAFEAAPDRLHACGLRAQELWSDAGRPEEALATLGSLIGRVSAEERQPLELSRARLLVVLGRDDEARHTLERLLMQASDPALQANAQADLGELLARAGDVEAALPHLAGAADRLVDGKRAAALALGAGRALAQLGLLHDALERFEQAATLDPSLAAAHEGIANCCRASNESADRLAIALEALASLAHSGAERARYLIERAELAAFADEPEVALDSYRRAITAAPRNVGAIEAARAIAVEVERYGLAAELYTQAIDVAPSNVTRARLSRELGLLFVQQLDDVEAATHHLGVALELDAEDDHAAEALLPLLEDAARHGEAGRLAQRLAERRRGDARRALRLRAAVSFEHAGWLDEARHIYRQVSSGADAMARRAAALLLEMDIGGGDAAAADAAIAAAIGNDRDKPTAADSERSKRDTEPEDLVPRRSVGDEVAALDDAELDHLTSVGEWEALAHALRMRARSAGDSDDRAELLLRLGHVLEDLLDRPFEALEIYAEAAIAAPAARHVLAALADAAYRHQDWQRALTTYNRLWQMRSEGDPTLVELAYRRGVVHEALGAHDAASRCYQDALDIDADFRPALETRARLSLFRDDIDTAITLLTRLAKQLSVDELSELLEVRERLGELHLRQGSLYTAREFLEAAVALDNRRVKSMQLLLSTYEQLGRYDDAVALLQKLIYNATDPLVRASLLHHRAELLASHLRDEESAVDCLLKAYDIAPNHVPTLWRLVDYYWSRTELKSVVEIGEELAKSRALSQSTPDRRHTRLAAAMLAHDRVDAAERLLASALSDEALVEPSLLDLARAIKYGSSRADIAALVIAADESGAVRQSAQRILRDHPNNTHLAELVDAILGGE